jgi:succinate-semialdehyde dehydrogenase / glutarate-semialdehyde dehydrogenase
LTLLENALLHDACRAGQSWPASGPWLDVYNPADEELVARVPLMGAPEAQSAVRLAAQAWPAWAARTAADRADVLRAFHDLIMARIEDLAAILTAEQGKPLSEARDEIRYAASYVQWFAEEARRAYGEVIPAPVADRRVFVLRQPVGVVAAITPWNFPAAMIARKIAPALAAGCAIIVKPAEQTPLTALALAVLAMQAGVPADVLTVLTGSAEQIGGVLTASPVVRKLSFTGSTAVGELLYRQCAPTIKKLSLELGGNAPLIVFDDADLDVAIAGAIAAKFRNAGQTCVCANRIFVQSGIHAAFVARFAEAAAALRVGRGDDPASQIGPLIDDDAVNRSQALLADAIAKGARLVTGGASLPGRSRFLQPTVLADVTPDMRCASEEIFAPLAPIITFASEAEAIAMANETASGLAGYVFTRDAGRQWRMAEALEVGMVGVNTGAISSAVVPFGGVKASGLGREGSRHGLDDYMELKTMWLAA